MADSNHAVQDPVITEFRDMLEQCTLLTVRGRPYVQVERLKSWMRTAIGPGSHTTHASRLLQTVYRPRSRYSPAPPISLKTLCHQRNGCLLVFSILLDLGRGQLVDCFQRQGIVDNNLPMDLGILQTKLRSLQGIELPDPNELAIKFNEMQWRFRPVQLDIEMGYFYEEERIIPVHGKKRINSKGGTAEVWLIYVLEEFVSEDLRKLVKTSCFDNPNDNLGPCYQFALKIFQEGYKSAFNNEKMAFQRLQEHDGMVRYLANYGHKEKRASHDLNPADPREDTVKETYNILLEYCDLDLDEFFIERFPPVLGSEVEAFWSALFEVADAVEFIHNLKDSYGENYYRGWHADIKPDNILSIEGRFKLADPGFAKFVKTTENDCQNMEQVVQGGTETYGAPERLLSGGEAVPVRQTIDTWSLGCVFSIAATWVVLGHQGIQPFSEMRLKAVEKEIKERHLRRRPSKPIPNMNPGDYFHNGEDVLKDVTEWHKVLRGALRKNDQITGRVLDLVDEKMLLGRADNRIEAKDICNELRKILTQSQAQARTREQVPHSFIDALIRADEAAPLKVIGSKLPREQQEDNQNLPIVEIRKARKTKLLNLPLMKTAHRSEGRKASFPSLSFQSYSLQQIDETQVEEILLHASPVGIGFPIPDEDMPPPSQVEGLSPVREVESPHGNGQASSPVSSPVISPTRPKAHRKRSKRPVYNVFRAREEVEKRERYNPLRLTRKDELLSKYYDGKRDIKFLVDNAETMKDYWWEATFLLETLVMKAAGQDENGMDLYFTRAGSKKVENQKTKSDFVSAMSSKSAKPMKDVHTDMRASLGDILDDYVAGYRAKKRKLTIIVLTDGKWEGMKNPNEVKSWIIKFLQVSMGKIGGLQHRPVSIEFIQFGNDPEATERLRELDDDLKGGDIEDIIDTEPSYGDVNKMLLGSFVEEYDDIKWEEEEVEDEANEGGAESAPKRMGSIKSQAGTIRPGRSATLESEAGRTITGMMNLFDAKTPVHSRKSTLDGPMSSSPPHVRDQGQP